MIERRHKCRRIERLKPAKIEKPKARAMIATLVGLLC